MIRKAAQIAVPIVGSAGIDVNKLIDEHEHLMKDLNEKLENGWMIFSTHTVTHNHTTYVVYVLTKSETEKHEEVEGW